MRLTRGARRILAAGDGREWFERVAARALRGRGQGGRGRGERRGAAAGAALAVGTDDDPACEKRGRV